MFEQIKEFINPIKNPDLAQAHELQRKHLPTLWLLGKTGAGKSLFIQAVTGLSSVEVGDAFELKRASMLKRLSTLLLRKLLMQVTYKEIDSV
ncbi:hypothetical protein [Psychromonas sp. MB-3u-54]|uniref:hypothetical protein n=1 Tax=Psychromonas sp. MB-3u-54 TaxID=2058319 RepID=UPI001E3D3793|nr:hypothetical protein [Psychromonas sp. MB-3u-54]